MIPAGNFFRPEHLFCLILNQISPKNKKRKFALQTKNVHKCTWSSQNDSVRVKLVCVKIIKILNLKFRAFGQIDVQRTAGGSYSFINWNSLIIKNFKYKTYSIIVLNFKLELLIFLKYSFLLREKSKSEGSGN